MSRNFMKKTLAGIFALVIVASSTPIAPFAPVMDSSSITVSAEMAPESDFIFDSGIISQYIGTDDDVEIPATIDGVPVTSIGEYAFFGSSVKSIIIPDPVSSIGNLAFQGSSDLASITLPKSLKSIGDNAFMGCSSLTSVTIPESVTSIGNNAFHSCSGLKSITLPKSLESIGSEAFTKCFAMKTVNYTGSDTDWKRIMIDSSNNERLQAANITYDFVPPAAESDFEFDASSGTITKYIGAGGDVEIPSKIGGVAVTSIGDCAFEDCSSLVSVTIPEGVTSIGASAFGYCSYLASVTIPKGVTSIGDCAFEYCSSLVSVTIPEGVTSIGMGAFAYCSKLASVTIPEGVTSIDDLAFAYCSKLASVTIPEGVTSIGVYAFSGCSSLTSITAPCTLKNSMSDAMGNCTAEITYTHPCTKSAEYTYKVKCACGDTDLDYTDVFVLLANEEAFLNNVNQDDYTEDSWKALYDAVTALAEIVSDFEENDFVSAQSELTAAISAYSTAKTDLELNLSDADYTELDAAIADANVYTADNYTEDSWAALETALAEANAVDRDLKEDQQDTINTAKNNLRDAIDGLVLKDADYTELEAAIADANVYTADNYTEDSWAALETALAEANAVDPDLKADQQGTIDTAKNNLRDAIAALEEKPKYDTLYEEYLVKAPTVTENGTYNKRAYHYENDAKVVDTEKVFAEDKAVTFEQWYLRTLIQYQVNDSEFDLRFVSMLDENLDQYQKAGFIFTINGTEVSDELSTVTANTSYIVDNEEVNISVFSEDNDYFFLQNYVFDIGEIDLDASLAVTAYVVLADGTKLQGTKAVTFTLRQFEG